MNKYYLLENAVKDSDIWVSDYEVPDEMEDKYCEGVSLGHLNGGVKLFYEYKSNKKTDYLAGIFSFSVVSARFKVLLMESGEKNIEFFPVKLINNKNDSTEEEYFFLNILNNVKCFDWANSEYEKSEYSSDYPNDVTRLSLVEEKLGGRHIARIEELPTLIVVSKELRQSIEKSGITGMQFKLPSDYSMYELP